MIKGGAGAVPPAVTCSIPLLAELQQNDVTGRVAQTRINGALLRFFQL